MFVWEDISKSDIPDRYFLSGRYTRDKMSYRRGSEDIGDIYILIGEHLEAISEISRCDFSDIKTPPQNCMLGYFKTIETLFDTVWNDSNDIRRY